MDSVGVGMLRQRASELLRRVEAGETIQVSDHGRPVALLTPLPEGSSIERLRATGDLEPGEGALRDLPAPIPLNQGQQPPSQILGRLRQDER
jgi:prevent-host-death family protein